MGAVDRDDAAALKEALESIPYQYHTVMALRAAHRALQKQRLYSLAQALDRKWGVDAGASQLLKKQSQKSSGQTLLEIFLDESSQKKSDPSYPRQQILKVFMEAGMPLQYSQFRNQPLTEAASHEDLELTRLLLEAGADKNGLYKRGGSHCWPPFCHVRSLPMLKLFLDHGVEDWRSPPGQPIGGIACVLMRWDEGRKADLPAAINLWLAAGGDWFKPLEKAYGMPVSLAEYVFDKAEWLDPSRKQSQTWEEKKHARVLLLQELLAQHGFDFDQVNSEGVSWRQLVAEKGSPRLAKALALEALPAALATPGRQRL